ncbi:MAG TPA: tetratricopeptide repeat protein, partial [Gammaproteobacteria bacterium]
AGIHEQLVTELAKIQDLNIIARTTMLRYSDSPPPIPDIASELRVETVMEGSVRYAGDQVRVTAQLIDGRTGVHLWTEDFDGDLTDIFGIQSAIATLIANALEAELTPEEQQGLERQLTSSPQALALYLGAISVTDTDSAIPVLEEATRIDSEFAAAYGLLAFYQAVSINGFFSISPDDGPRMVREAQSNARQALFLDPSLGVAHAALGAIHLANWRAQDAEDSLRLAIELSPSAVGVAQMYARFKRHRREYGEAIELMERVVELDPNNAARQQNLGVAYRYAGDYDRAVVAFLDGLNLEPSSVSLTVNLAIAEAGRGDFDKAIQALQRAEILAGSDQGLETFRIPQMARIYSIVGRPDDAMRLFSVLQERASRQPIGEAVWAAAYSAIGDHETALRHLDVALDERLPTDAAMLGQLAANVFVDPVIETDPRYRERLGRLWDDEG